MVKRDTGVPNRVALPLADRATPLVFGDTGESRETPWGRIL